MKEEAFFLEVIVSYGLLNLQATTVDLRLGHF